MNTTTIKIYKNDLSWWKMCCEVKDKNSQDVFSEFKLKVNMKHEQKFYDSLPKPNNYHKPLEYKKLNKKYTKN